MILFEFASGTLKMTYTKTNKESLYTVLTSWCFKLSLYDSNKFTIYKHESVIKSWISTVYCNCY